MTTTPDLATLFDCHQRAVLAFSGGKDSLVCLDLCRDYRDKLTVVWVNTGAAFPHMVEFVRKAAEGYSLIELHSDQAAWHAQHGLPAEIVPGANSAWRVAPNYNAEIAPASTRSRMVKVDGNTRHRRNEKWLESMISILPH